MADYAELLNIIKKASTEAVEASKPVNVCFGKVTSSSPLKILVDQKMTLGSAQLVLSRNVTDFETYVTVEWESESELGSHTHSVNIDGISGNTGSKNLSHTHSIMGKKKIKVHNGLATGDEVIMLRMQGGQKYIVLDRIGGG